MALDSYTVGAYDVKRSSFRFLNRWSWIRTRKVTRAETLFDGGYAHTKRGAIRAARKLTSA